MKKQKPTGRYPEIITPKESHAILSRVDYDPYRLMPNSLREGPRVLYSEDDLARMRTFIKRGGWPRRAFDSLIDSCRAKPAIPDRLPRTPVGADNEAIATIAEQHALALHLSGDRKYFAPARQALRLLAQSYEQWPIVHGTRAEPKQDLSESFLIMSFASTYDLLHAAGGLTDADHRLFHRFMAACIDTMRAGEHSGCGNHNLGTLTGRLAAALTIDDRQTIHDVLYGVEDRGVWRYGLVHTLRHDILADGLHWERSFGYHCYILSVLADLADMFTRNGVDLWHTLLPALNQNDGTDIHRAYGPSGARCIKAAFDAPLYLAFAGGDLAMIHDTSMSNLREAHWRITYNLAYDVYRDERYAWLINHFETSREPRKRPGLPIFLQQHRGSCDFVRLRTVEYPAVKMDYGRDAQFAQTGIHAGRCSLFPVHGTAVLRSKRGPGATILWGPHSAGHQDPAALHVDLHTGSGRITDGVIVASYGESLHLDWCRTTIAHNTVTVDEQAMVPYDRPTESPWECDHWRDTITDGTL